MATQTWLITGSSRGLGREIAHAALQRGDQVVATARDPQHIDALVNQYGERARAIGLDVTDRDAAHAAIAAAVDAFGRLDVVVNNAGYANSAAIEEMDPADFRAQVEANFYGVVHVTRAALPVLRRQRSGTFVQVSSVGGRVGGTPGLSAYQAAKFAVEGFSEGLASEVAPFGLKVIIVEPGALRTDWQGSSMTRHAVGTAYAETVGAIHAVRDATDGAQPGDPARAAQAILAVVGEDDPPRRLLLGADAVTIARAAEERRRQELERWAAVGASVGFASDSAQTGLPLRRPLE
jgi:NAD(P)-dependent dehydrogenase (short-subunit alcohol dehydrogenase family)